MRAWGREFQASGWWHSFELPDGRRIEGANSIEGLERRAAVFPIAPDLAGKRVLDIGAWDGWFSFEMERRGAEVVAVDCVDNRNFREIHLKHPLLALERICALTRDLAVVQTFVTADAGPPAMQFYETHELGGQFDNWVGPNLACVLAWCRMAGFRNVNLLNVDDHDAAVACYRAVGQP
jgi:hypothetical protein